MVLRGRQILHTPGPTIMPDRLLRAMDRQAMEHRGGEFGAMAREMFAGLARIFKTKSPVLVQPSSGSGAWEGALTNVCQPGDKIAMAETGVFSEFWHAMAKAHGLDVAYVENDWREPIDANKIEALLRADKSHAIKAVCMVHNETSTGMTHPLVAVRQAIDAAAHPAIFMVDAISSLASMEFEMDAWGIDVAICGAQKGFMLPPGLGLIGVSPKALEAGRNNPGHRFYMDWRKLIPDDKNPNYVTTPAINMMFGLMESVRMLEEEGLDNVFARHARLAGLVRACVNGWSGNGTGPSIFGRQPETHSNSVTAIWMPEGHDANELRRHCLDEYNLVLGAGIGRMSGKAFRIGHLGDLNEPMILGALAAAEAGLEACNVPHGPGIAAAVAELAK